MNYRHVPGKAETNCLSQTETDCDFHGLLGPFKPAAGSAQDTRGGPLMCGIIGILGSTPVADQMVDALKRLEYRPASRLSKAVS